MQIFFSVGEPSGDQHAAHLIQELRKRRADIEFTGFGGPLMEQAGCRQLFQLTDLAVMGVFAVIPLLWKFIKLVGQARRYFEEHRPDAVVLVDFPGFNWWIARKAKAAGIPVFYYLPPQLWAWAPWRIHRVRKFIDHVLCALPFEMDWYAARGVHAEYVGHPFFDEVADKPIDEAFIKQWTSEPAVANVGVLPGSRNQEVTRNFPMMVEVMRRVHGEQPQARFLVACYKQSQFDWCQQYVQQSGDDLPIQLFVNRTSEIIESARCCMMVSGSVSLELLARRTPTVVLYRATRFFRMMARMLIICKYISLPNLIADREIMPEFPSAGDPNPDINNMTRILATWLGDERACTEVEKDLDNLCTHTVKTGATARTASLILKKLEAPEDVQTKAAA